jgi:hypothetical protein
MLSIVDKVFVQPCLNERQGFFSMSPENLEGRVGPDGQNTVGVKCSSKDVTKYNQNPIVNAGMLYECNYDQRLSYWDYPKEFYSKCDKVPVAQMWGNITQNIIKTMSETKVDDTTIQLFVMVVHHNRLKHNILNLSANSTIDGFANGSVVMVSNRDENQVVFGGFPDKATYKYANETNFNFESDLSTETLAAIDMFTQSCHNLGHFQLCIIRHGNALHNHPLNIRNFIKQGPLDSCLTELGIAQSRVVGNVLETFNSGDDVVLHLVSSYLNRSQHTAITIANEMFQLTTNDGEFHTKNPQLSYLEKKFNMDSSDKIKRYMKNMNMTDYNKMLDTRDEMADLYDIYIRQDSVE